MYRYIRHYVQLYTDMYRYMQTFAVVDKDTNTKDRQAQVQNSPKSTVAYPPCNSNNTFLPVEQLLPLHRPVSITSLEYLFPFIKFHLHITMKINHKNHAIHYTRCPQFASHDNMQANPERHSLSITSFPIGQNPLGNNPAPRAPTCNSVTKRQGGGGK